MQRRARAVSLLASTACSRGPGFAWHAAIALLLSCGPAPDPQAPISWTDAPGAPPIAAAPAQPEALAPLSPSPAAPVEPLADAPGPMDRGAAERYVVALVDRDRAAQGLAPLRWDETAARAARRHVRDLLAHGVTSHVGTDGSVPEQRYTAEGGRSMAWENVACFSDGEPRTPAVEPRYFADSLAGIEHAFLDEPPGHDGHRRNLLAPHRTAIGVGLAASRGARLACMVQELVDDAGVYEPLPRTASAGDVVEVSGLLRAPWRVLAVGVSRIDLPRPRTADELRPTRGYRIPAPQAVYQPAGYGTRIPLETDARGSGFRIEVPLGDKGSPGLYEISVWAGAPGATDPELVSLRTIEAP